MEGEGCDEVGDSAENVRVRRDEGKNGKVLNGRLVHLPDMGETVRSDAHVHTYHFGTHR